MLLSVTELLHNFESAHELSAKHKHQECREEDVVEDVP